MPKKSLARRASLAVMEALSGKKSDAEDRAEKVLVAREEPQIILEEAKHVPLARPELQGWLEKRGDRGLIKTWKKRWFYLDDNYLLHYQELEGSPVPLGYIPLATAVEAGNAVKILPDMDPAAFSIDVPGRSYILKAATQESMTWWINQLNAVLKYIQKDFGGKILEECQQNSIEQKVKAGNFVGLVHTLTLTHGHTYDKEYTNTFLMTFRSFCTPLEVLEELTHIYKLAVEDGSNTTTRPRIYGFISQWLENLTTKYDLIEDEKIQKQFSILIKLMNKDMKTESEMLEGIIEKRRVETKHINYESIARLTPLYELQKKMDGVKLSSPLLPPTIKTLKPNEILFKVDPLEIARQICLIEFNLYHCILPRECLDQNWNKDPEKAPNIKELVRRFNHSSAWVATEILKREDIKSRAEVLQRLIAIASKCRDLHNFNAVAEFVAGIENASIHRLKKTWRALPQSAHTAFEQIKAVVAPNSNYKGLRASLQTCPMPCLPYIGIFLTDLVFIDDGNPNRISGLINFAKRRQIGAVISLIQSFQREPYCFEAVPPIQEMLVNAETMTDDALFELSLKREPREVTASPVI